MSGGSLTDYPVPMIRIVDYGMGNLRSVQKAFESLGVPAEITADPDAVADAQKVVLPGQGAFRDCIANLRSAGLDEPVLAQIAADRPLLGICVGQQLLFDRSYEDGEHAGLGVLRGEVRRFAGPPFERDGAGDRPRLKVPLMGWTTLSRPGGSLHEIAIFRDLPPDPSVYFVHSYHTVPEDRAVVAAEADYGGPFVAAVARGNLFACQFHPEKSQAVGLRILQNFADL